MSNATGAYQAYGGRLPSTAEILALNADDLEKLHLLKLKRVCIVTLSIQILNIVALAIMITMIADKGSLPVESQDAYILGLIMGALSVNGLLTAIISMHYAGNLKVDMREAMFREPEDETKTPS